MHAKPHKAESALSKSFAKGVSYINILHFLKFLIVAHRKLLFELVFSKVSKVVGFGLSGGI